MSRKSIAASLLGNCGLLWLPPSIPKNRLIVLTYHRVVPDGMVPEFHRGAVSATETAFRAQMEWLSRRCHCPGLDEVLSTLERKFLFHNPSVLITFDDGYADSHQVAFPILQELGVPALFFIPTDLVGRRRLGWWDHTAYALRRSRLERIVLEYPVPLTLDLPAGSREPAIRMALQAIKKARELDRDRFLDHLRDRSGVAAPPPELESRELVDWDRLREMQEGGMAIGGHSHSHRTLSGLPEEQQRRELAGSLRILREKVGPGVCAMAYPSGRPEDFTDGTKRLARDTLWKAAFSFYGGANRGGWTDPYDIRRVAIRSSMGFHDFRALVRFPGIFGSA